MKKWHGEYIYKNSQSLVLIVFIAAAYITSSITFHPKHHQAEWCQPDANSASNLYLKKLGHKQHQSHSFSLSSPSLG